MCVYNVQILLAQNRSDVSEEYSGIWIDPRGLKSEVTEIETETEKETETETEAEDTADISYRTRNKSPTIFRL
jgi:hypothetical protein